jgi:type II secretory pathway pseudopilin PulG
MKHTEQNRTELFSREQQPTFLRPRFRSQRGVSLVESLIGLLVFTIILLAGAQIFRGQVQHLVLTERARNADTQANAALSALASFNQSAIPDCNPYAGKSATATIADGEQLALDSNACSTTYSCDKVVKVPQPSGTAFDYVVVPWNQTLPTGSTLTYYRAWRVTTLDAVRHLRRITVAVIPADLGTQPGDAVEPLALRISDVVQRQ